MDPTGAARMGQLVVNCLAVGGGYLIGWFAVAAISRMVIFQKSPKSVQTASRNLGGAACAILVAMIVFGHGNGWTLMGGGATGTDNGGEKATPVSTTITEISEKTSTTPTALKSLPPIDERVRVTILGGDDVREERFYLVNDDPKSKTLDEAKSAITSVRDALTGKRVGVEIRFSTANALPQEHPAVMRLARWVRNEAGLTVSFPAE